ncbi:MAG: hypothetical protein ACXVQY_11655 [Actinomycetota bacterium]
MKPIALRAGLLVVGVPTAVTGAWALFGPESFFRSFPRGAAHAWVAPLGPYDEHLVRDVGSLLLALGVLLVIAGVVLERRLVLAAVATSLIYDIPHFIFHAAHRATLSSIDYALNYTLLGGSVVILAAVGIGAAMRAKGS